MRRKSDTDENHDHDPNNGHSDKNNNNKHDTDKQASLKDSFKPSGPTNETNLREASRIASLAAFSCVRMNKKWVDLMKRDSWNVDDEKELSRRRSCVSTRSSRLLGDDEEPVALDCLMVETVSPSHRAHNAATDKRARSTSSLGATNQRQEQQQQEAKRRRRVPRLNRTTDTVGQVTRAAVFGGRQTADEDSGRSSGSTSPHPRTTSVATGAATGDIAKDEGTISRAAKGELVNQTSKLTNTCAACHKPIRERYLLQSMDKQWHEDCLKCACCDCRLGEVGSSLFTHSGKILCRRDFLRIFGQQGLCAACKRSIPPYELVMRANENAYHMDCFNCQQCQYRFCVGDRFHLTDSQRIVCLLCHAESISVQASASALASSAASVPVPVPALNSAGPQQQQQQQHKQKQHQPPQQQPQYTSDQTGNLQQVAATKPSGCLSELDLELNTANCQSALPDASQKDSPNRLVSCATKIEPSPTQLAAPTELASSGRLQSAAAI